MANRRPRTGHALWRVALAIWLGAVLESARVRASELVVEGSQDCVEAEALRFQVERTLGASLGETGDVGLHVRAERTGAAAAARLRVVRSGLESAPSERELSAASCTKLLDTLAVAICLVVDDRAAHGQQTALPTLPVRGREAAPPNTDTLRPSTSAIAPRGPLWTAGAQAVVELGSLPGAAPGVALGLGSTWSTLQLWALATVLFNQQARLSRTAPAVGGELGLAYGSLLGCAPAVGDRDAALSAWLCMGLDGGRVTGVGTGVNQARERAFLWLAPRARLELVWQPPGTELGLGASVGVAVPVNRDSFVLDAIGTVHRPEALARQLGLGAQLRFE